MSDSRQQKSIHCGMSPDYRSLPDSTPIPTKTLAATQAWSSMTIGAVINSRSRKRFHHLQIIYYRQTGVYLIIFEKTVYRIKRFLEEIAHCIKRFLSKIAYYRKLFAIFVPT